MIKSEFRYIYIEFVIINNMNFTNLCHFLPSPVSWGDLATRLYKDVDDDGVCIVDDGKKTDE